MILRNYDVQCLVTYCNVWQRTEYPKYATLCFNFYVVCGKAHVSGVYKDNYSENFRIFWRIMEDFGAFWASEAELWLYNQCKHCENSFCYWLLGNFLSKILDLFCEKKRITNVYDISKFHKKTPITIRVTSG